MTDGDAPKVTVSELEAKIIKQLEYYFGDMNYTRDKFLQGKAKENEGWIDLKVLLTFNRLKELSTDAAVITKAMSKSTNELIEVNDRGDGTVLMKRVAPIVSDDLTFWQDVRGRSVYVKGFPTEATIGDIEKVLGKFGTLSNVVMRRTRGDEPKFKGSVFACYASKDDCKKLLDADLKTETGEPLIKQWQEEYHQAKIAERREHREKVRAEKGIVAKPDKRMKEAPAIKFEAGLIAHLSGLAPTTTYVMIKETIGRDKIAYVEHKDGDKEATIRLRPVKSDVKVDAATTEVKAETEAVKAETNGDAAKTEAVKDEAADVKPETAEPAKPEVATEEAKTDAKADATVLTEATKIDGVLYAETLLKSLEKDGKLMIDGAEIAWRMVVGDEETAYYERLREQAQNSAPSANRGRGGGRGGRGMGRGRGGRGGGRGRGGRDNGFDARANKRKQADAAQEGTDAKVAKPEGKHTKFEEA